jgi:ABC-type nickel/cobalt efflux system permease component RcnA
MILVLCIIALGLLLPHHADAHPVPRNQHDRTAVVELTPDPARREIVVTVNYHLEVDELTVVLDDMIPFSEEVRYDRFKNKPMEFYGEFTRIYAPIYAGNLIAKVGDRAVRFVCEKRSHTRHDEDGKALGHLRCDFVFVARFPWRPGQQQTFTFRESNYETQAGQIKLSWSVGGVLLSGKNQHRQRSFVGHTWILNVASEKVPDAALQAKALVDLRPGDDAKLREMAVTFTCSPIADAVTTPADQGTVLPPTVEHETRHAAGETATRAPPTRHKDAGPAKTGNASPPAPGQDADQSTGIGLLDLLLTNHALPLLLLLAGLFGAAHALTPGHGKTLVAAYLVGQRGTVGHALLLGVVTTLTHTGVVLVFAVVLLFLSPETREQIANALGLAVGLAIVCLGVWLLLQRLAGRADHFHIGGHHHHHHDGHYHHHDPTPPEGPLSWWGLIVMGMTGGITPCWDAVVILGYAVSSNQLDRALPMLLAFSAGLASVLVLIGILVVHARKLLDARWSGSRGVKLLPIASALFIAGMGLVVCYQGVQGKLHDDHRPAQSAAPR